MFKSKPYLLYQKGYEPFIDFFKGYLILCILFTHSCDIWMPLRERSLYHLWGCAPTACFMMISTMHIFRKGLNNASITLGKHIKKVLLPFLIIQLSALIINIILKPINEVFEGIPAFIKSGGYGIGSYFPWVYIQYILLMMFLCPIVKKIHDRRKLFLFFLIISITIELLCSLFKLDDGWYRILVLRYPFLIYLGLLLDEDGVFLSVKRCIISLIGLFFIIMFTYGNVNLEPIFYNSTWKTYHWICYPYLAFFLTFFVYVLFAKTKDFHFSRLMIRIGKSSYGIYLFQLIWFMFPLASKTRMGGWEIVLYLVISMSVCTFCGILLNEKVLEKVYNHQGNIKI